MKRNRAYYLLLVLLGTALISSCKKDKMDPPIADFTYTVNGAVVTFTSTSQNSPTSLDWDFGDGQKASGATVTHDFNADSTFTVTLNATNDNGVNSAAKQVTVGIKRELVNIHTDFGDMVMWLYDETPKHKENFLKLAGENFFDSTTFHRIVQNFVIQGGDPNSRDTDPTNDGYGGPGYTIDAEIKPGLKHDYGAVGAARDNNPQKASNGSQFYIVVNKNGDHNLDGNYTVFGMIIKGMDVAEQIAVQAKDANDRPTSDIRMDVNIIEKTKAQIKDEYGYTIH